MISFTRNDFILVFFFASKFCINSIEPQKRRENIRKLFFQHSQIGINCESSPFYLPFFVVVAETELAWEKYGADAVFMR